MPVEKRLGRLHVADTEGETVMVRRVVTGNDSTGGSFFVIDGETPHRWDLGSIEVDDVWVDDAQRPAADDDYDPVSDGYLKLVPPPGGSVARLVTFFPLNRSDPPSPDALAEARDHWDTGGHMESNDPAMHTTATIGRGTRTAQNGHGVAPLNTARSDRRD